MKRHITLLLLILGLATACNSSREELSVLQINIWQEGTIVPDGFTGIVDIIDQLDPDIVFLSEIRDYKDEKFIPKLLHALEQRGKTYNGENLSLDVGILSRYELKHTINPFTLENQSSPILKASIEAKGQIFTLYSAHLDYTHYECYLPRGYSGTTWKKIEAPVTDSAYIQQANRLSFRDEAIAAFIKDAQKEIEKGNHILLAGDFNEPSHLDWQADTKDMWDHNGTVVNWDCSVMLQNAGYIDTFREKYPDAVRYPGFTFPSANPDVPLEKLAWAPEADERDRIDFIYYYPAPSLQLKKSAIVGPSRTIIRGEEAENDSSDTFIEPKGIWPTDHKAMFAVFTIK